MNRTKINLTYLFVSGVLLCSLILFLFLNHFSVIRSIEMFVEERPLFLIPLLLFFYILLVVVRGQRRFRLIFVALAPLTLYLLLISGYNIAVNFNVILPKPPVTGSLPADNGKGLLGFIPIFFAGLIVSYVFIERIDSVERIFLALGLGFGITSLMMTFLGIFHAITLTNVFAVQLAIVFLALIFIAQRRISLKPKVSLTKSLKQFFSKLSFKEVIFAFLLGGFILIATYQAIAYPPFEWDSLAYGLNYAKKIFEYKGIPVVAGPSIGFEMSAAYPPGLQLLACYFYEIAGSPDDFYYRVLQPIFGVATLLVTYKLTLNLIGDKRYALIGVGALVASFLFWLYFILASYIMYFSFMIVLTIYFLDKAYKPTTLNPNKYEILAAVFAGFSALISYLGLSIIGFILLYNLARRKISKRKILIVLLATLIASSWYMRNFLLLGNPIYPFLGFGINLDPLISKSTALHFQHYKTAEYLLGAFDFAFFQPSTWMSVFLPFIFYPLVFILRSKQKEKLLWTFFLYSFAVFLGLAAFHVLFSRYISFFLPIYSSLLAFSINSLEKLRKTFSPTSYVSKFVVIAWITILIISFVDAFALMSSIKSPLTPVSDEWDYFRLIYDDADVWKWINENVPAETRIATYEIREHYIERDIMLLDGYESAPLYDMNIDEAIAFLRGHNVGYVLSVPWASPLDPKIPPAYKWNVLMKNLSHLDYLPPVYVSQSGAAVYHVGPIDDQELYDAFWSKNLVPPLKSIEVNLTVTNATTPPRAMTYVPIPCDYVKGLMMVSMNSYGHNVSVELFRGSIPTNLKTDWGKQYEMIKRGPRINYSLGINDSGFTWTIDSAGYFTLLVPSLENFTKPFNVTVNIRFFTELETETLFIKSNNFSGNVTINNYTEPPTYTVYLEINSPSVVEIKSKDSGKNISIEIYKGLIPLNVRNMQWWLAETHVSFFHIENATKDTIMSKAFLLPEKYTLALIYWDTLQTPINLQLEVTVNPLI